MKQPAVALDVTPLQNAHRFRGIGRYVSGLAERLLEQTEIPLELWGWKRAFPLEVNPPHRTRLLTRFPRPEYRGAWAFAQLEMHLRARTSASRVVHITGPEGATALKGRGLVITVYDLIPQLGGSGRAQILRRIGDRRYESTLRDADILLAISEGTRSDVLDRLALAPDRVRLARPGVAIRAPITKSSGRAAPYFLYLGSWEPHKNLEVLLEAFRQVPDLPELLVIAGRWMPSQQQAFRQMVTADPRLSGRVEHVGYVSDEDLDQLLNGATAVVMPSLHEGYGLPVAEAMAAGTVVVHSAIAVLEETSREAALTFPASSAVDLAGLLRRVSGDDQLRLRYRKLGLERARQINWDGAVAATLEAYRSLLARVPNSLADED